MPVLSNPRHERFAQLLAQGKSAVGAYEQAGYRRDDGNAVRLTKKTVETLLRELDDIRQRAMASGQLSAGVAAIKEMGVLSGVRVERKEVGAAGEFDHLSDDELERLLVERFIALGLNARCPK